MLTIERHPRLDRGSRKTFNNSELDSRFRGNDVVQNIEIHDYK